MINIKLRDPCARRAWNLVPQASPHGRKRNKIRKFADSLPAALIVLRAQAEPSFRFGGSPCRSSHGDDEDYMNVAYKEKIIGTTALFTSFAFFGAIIAGLIG